MSHSPDTLGLPGLSVLVLGLARSGVGVASLLRRHGFAVRAVDARESGQLPGVDRLEREGVECLTGTSDAGLLAGMNWVVVSPGVPPDSSIYAAALTRGIPVLGELEVASRFVKGPVLAVTGTNGKTTTASWLAHLVRGAGRDVALAGNVGSALSEVADHLGADTFVVLEVSSFQLERIERFHARSAALLNLTPDHLDRYPSMREYGAAKARIFETQQPGDVAVLRAHDPQLRPFEPAVRARLAHFDAAGPVGEGAGVLDGSLCLFRQGTATPVLERSRLALPGPHNLENALAALAMTLPWEFSPESLALGLSQFPALPHRLEPCGEVRGVRFVNDSKATNVDSLEKALLSFDVPLHLIAGGRDKKGDFERLLPLVRQRVKALWLIGEAADRIAQAWPGPPATRCATLEEAVESALRQAVSGEVVLLSPGCASFDMFRDYEDRGDRFRRAVATLATGGSVPC